MSKTKEKIDVLGREKIVEFLQNLINTLDCSKSNRSFCINGVWGCGKSFIIEQLESKCKDNKDCIFINYNAWKNNYYDEPLIAMVTSIIDQLNDYYNSSTLKVVKEVVEKCIRSLWEVVKTLGKTTAILLGQSNLISVNEEVKNCRKSIKKIADEKVIKNEIDNCISLKIALDKIRDSLSALNKKIIFVIDELDRCLPDYAIKVLERSHHVFTDLENTISIYCVDKKQLNQLIQNFYGNSLDIEKYMEKFIEFSYDISIGSFNAKFKEIFYEYLENFDISNERAFQNFVNYADLLLKYIDIRKRIQIIKRAHLLHKLVIKEQCDLSMAYFELITIVLFDIYKTQTNNFLSNYFTPKGSSFISGHQKICFTKMFESVDLYDCYVNSAKMQGITIKNVDQIDKLVYLYMCEISSHQIRCEIETDKEPETIVLKDKVNSNCEKAKNFYKNLNLIR